MLELVSTLVANPLVDLALKIMGVVGLVIGAMALRAANAAVQATKASDIISLKMKAVESMAVAERALISLQSTAQSIRSSWNEHIARHYSAPLGLRYKPDELQRNAAVEREAVCLLQDLLAGFGNIDAVDRGGLEQKIGEAHRATAEIDRLSLRLEGPPASRF